MQNGIALAICLVAVIGCSYLVYSTHQSKVILPKRTKEFDRFKKLCDPFSYATSSVRMQLGDGSWVNIDSAIINFDQVESVDDSIRTEMTLETVPLPDKPLEFTIQKDW